jgi:hypothetical protein
MVSDRVRPAWEFRAASAIWRILPAGEEYIVGEVRDSGKKTVSFFAVRLDDGRRCWEGNVLPEKWWAGIEASHGTTLFLHEYPVPSMPDHRKIFAVDIPTGNLLWKNEELAFSFASDDGVYGSRDFFDRRAYYKLDEATGETGEEIPTETIVLLMARKPAGWGEHIEMPGTDEEIPAVVGAHPGLSADPLPGESLRRGDVVVLTCFDRIPGSGQGPSMREHLFVISGSGVLFHDVACDGMTGPVPGTFFRFRDRVLYIKNRSILRSLAIPS